MTGYRGRLYRAHLSTHLETCCPATLGGLERDRRLFRSLYRRLLPQSHQGEILEVGCGTGSFLFFLRSEDYEQIRGIDLGEEQIAVARTLGIDDVEVADGFTYGFAGAGRWVLWQIFKQLIRLYLLVEQGVPGRGVFTAKLCAVGMKA